MASITFLSGADIGETGLETPVSSMAPYALGDLSPEARDSFREGLEWLGRGEPREAIQRLETAVARAPHYSNAFVGLGIAYAMDSQVYPALDNFERAAEVDPGNFFAHFKLAQFHFKLRIPRKGYEEAARALECATTLEEKRLIAQILKEERQRETNGVSRPTWSKPFSRNWLRAAFILLLAACAMLVLYMK